MHVLIVEDSQNRIDWFKAKFNSKHDVVHYASTTKQANDYLNMHRYNVIFIDHDLNGSMYMPTHSPESGSEVVRHMITIAANVDIVIVHSHNEPAALSMVSVLMENGYAVCRQPFKHLAYKHSKELLLSRK